MNVHSAIHASGVLAQSKTDSEIVKNIIAKIVLIAATMAW
jgi:hypothetical protein